MDDIDAQHAMLSEQAREYVIRFEAQMQKGAELERLLVSAVAMQNKAAEAGNDERVAAVADAVTFMETKYKVDAANAAGHAAAARAGRDTGHGVFNMKSPGTLSHALKKRSQTEEQKSQVHAIIAKVAELYDLPAEDFIGAQLKGTKAQANRMGVYITRNVTDLTWGEIGKIFIGDDLNAESKATGGIHKYQKFMQESKRPDIQEKLEQIMADLGLKEVQNRRRNAYGK